MTELCTLLDLDRNYLYMYRVALFSTHYYVPRSLEKLASIRVTSIQCSFTDLLDTYVGGDVPWQPVYTYATPLAYMHHDNSLPLSCSRSTNPFVYLVK